MYSNSLLQSINFITGQSLSKREYVKLPFTTRINCCLVNLKLRTHLFLLSWTIPLNLGACISVYVQSSELFGQTTPFPNLSRTHFISTWRPQLPNLISHLKLSRFLTAWNTGRKKCGNPRYQVCLFIITDGTFNPPGTACNI